MTELDAQDIAEMIELQRRIYSKPDEYAEAVKFCEDFLYYEYSRLTKKHARKIAAWRCNALAEQLEQQHKVKLFVRFE